jgi:hypothetical protein
MTDRSALAARVRAALSEVPDDGYTVEDLCLLTGYTIRTVSHALRDLADDGVVVEGPGSVYSISPGAPTSSSSRPRPLHGPPRPSRMPPAPPELAEVDALLREAQDTISRWTSYAAALTTYRRAIAPRRSSR